ncbi:ABC transporter ATP-binding protein [Paenibacillus endoradicis]|uniref:ABC transporter ATP-binding protein n=1 Tax=Paenibacillus endoradicis TaxID=2972487 RepID=UPI002159873A|nr:ABC transporter ATP-binding protein [Paenibacillus endoradicis]MCR8658760.1 ABC transporter ATP-binding protein [Paenibacillus endoradicis]
MTTTLTISKLTKTFSNGEVSEQILKGVNLEVNSGEVTALVGASGSGKSTLLTIAAGLQSASSGQIMFQGKDLTTMSQEGIRQLRASQFGFVFQSSHLVPFLTVEDQLLLMLDVAENKHSKQDRKKTVTAMLQLVGMEHRQHAYPSSLSGGEKQRVAIARAIIHQPQILFADEPTASLDSSRSKDVMTLIQSITKKLNIATLLVTHDEEMLPFADRVITMRDGVIL